MKILVVSQMADWLDGALKMQAAGNEVLFWVGNKLYWDVGDGLITKVRGQWQNKMSWADLIVFDNIGFGKYEGMLIENKKRFIGCSRQGELLCKDRKRFNDFLVNSKMDSLTPINCESIKQAIEHVEANHKRYFVYSKELQEKYCDYKGVFSDGSDVIGYLSYIKNNDKLDARKGLILYEIPDGVMLSIGAYFNGEKFLAPYQISLGNKKDFDFGALFVGSVGKTQKEFLKSVPFLSSINFRGYFTLTFLVTKDNVYAVEGSVRLSFPDAFVQDECISEDWGSFLLRLASGGNGSLPVKNSFSVSIGVSSGKPEMPCFGINSSNITKIHLVHAKEKDKTIMASFSPGKVFVCTASAPKMSEAKAKAIGLLKEVVLPDCSYCADVANEWLKDLSKLQTWGYL